MNQFGIFNFNNRVSSENMKDMEDFQDDIINHFSSIFSLMKNYFEVGGMQDKVSIEDFVERVKDEYFDSEETSTLFQALRMVSTEKFKYCMSLVQIFLNNQEQDLKNEIYIISDFDKHFVKNRIMVASKSPKPDHRNDMTNLHMQIS